MRRRDDDDDDDADDGDKQQFYGAAILSYAPRDNLCWESSCLADNLCLDDKTTITRTVSSVQNKCDQISSLMRCLSCDARGQTSMEVESVERMQHL